MKTLLHKIIGTIFILAFLQGTRSNAQMQVRKVVKTNMHLLESYQYDGYATNTVKVDSTEEKIEVQFTAFKGVAYRLLFCHKGLDEGVHIQIYDKNKRSRKRNLIYDNQDKTCDPYWVFETNKQGNYYIEYNIPPSKKESFKKSKAYMVIMVGANLQNQNGYSASIFRDF